MDSITRRAYQILNQLERHTWQTQSWMRPHNGIYVFYEKGETVTDGGHTWDRIVRIGTHRRDGNFRARIRQHYGPASNLGGNKNSSVFRKHLGGAIMRQRDPEDPRLKSWLKQDGPTYREVEEEVSRSLRDHFTFVCFRVDEAADRLALESGLIALMAQAPLGEPSADWLGRYAAAVAIRQSGLWNTQCIDQRPIDAQQLEKLDRFVDRWLEEVAR